MERDDEYELLPRQEVENLKREIERLKKNPLGELKEGKTLLDAVNSLNDSMKKLIDIFSKAEADLAKEYAENNPAEDLKMIKEQNEQIAQGLLAVAELVKEMKDRSAGPQRSAPQGMQMGQPNQLFSQQPSQPQQFGQEPFPNFDQPMQEPSMPQFGFEQSQPMQPGGQMPNQMPRMNPLPPPERKRGLFSRK